MPTRASRRYPAMTRLTKWSQIIPVVRSAPSNSYEMMRLASVSATLIAVWIGLNKRCPYLAPVVIIATLLWASSISWLWSLIMFSLMARAPARLDCQIWTSWP